MDISKIIQALIFNHNSYPAVKLVCECQFPLIEAPQLPLMSPSHYMKEVSMSTEERLTTLCKQQAKLEFWDSSNDLNIVPSIIVFQNFEPLKSYSITITIRNISNRMQKVVLLIDKSAEFVLPEKSKQINKFAPGMIFKATINFHPQEDRDIFEKLVVVTKDSRFAIPILGIGGKGVLNPPDFINFLQVPVKYLKTKLITMTNVGRKSARFLLSANGPFSVSPERGVVPAKESFVMEVSFYSEEASKHNGMLFIQYENGEQVTVLLEAESVNSRMSMFPPAICVDDTYIGLKSFDYVKLTNDSNVVAEFVWKKYGSITDAAEDGGRSNDESSRRLTNHYVHTKYLCNDDQNEIHGEPSVLCLQCSIPSSELVDDWDVNFPPEDFLIEPVMGRIQPHSSIDCVVFFSPYKPTVYESYAYCEITGREERLMLSLRGQGIRPKFTFGFDENFIPLPLIGGHKNKSESVTHEVVLEISIDKESGSEIKLGLFGGAVPKTVQNFVSICMDGVHGKTYVGSGFHRIIKNFMIQGGDIVKGDGTGSTSIYGPRFDDENFHIKHAGAGFVSMVNSGPNTNGCQFFITATATPWLDGHHVVFGKVIDGLGVVKTVEKLKVGANDKPESQVVITKCEVTVLPEPYDLPLQ